MTAYTREQVQEMLGPADPGDSDPVAQFLRFHAEKGCPTATESLLLYRVRKRIAGNVHECFTHHLRLLESRVHPDIHALIACDVELLKQLS